MSYIYLIRHGKPDFPDNIPICIGCKIDLPIDKEGEKQAAVWKGCFSQCNIIYHSYLLRAKQTAAVLAEGRNLRELDGVQEMDVGEWEGKTFKYLKQEYPEIYKKRGADWSVDLPGGESLINVADRALEAIENVLKSKRQPPDMVVVTHDGVIRSILLKLLKLDPTSAPMPLQPYGSITTLEYRNREFTVLSVGHLPHDYPSMDEIKSLWAKWETPYKVIDHCKKTAEIVKNTAVLINEKQEEKIDVNRVYAAALLHDVARNFKFHAEKGGEILKGAGYTTVSEIINIHHNLTKVEENIITETELLYWADKRLKNTEIVSVEQRFKEAKAKCNGYEATKRMEQRFRSAKAIEEKIVALIGEDPCACRD